MQRLLFLQQIRDQVKGTGIVPTYDKIMGEIQAMPEEMNDIMANPVIVGFFEAIGATHWELTEIPNGRIDQPFPENFYNPPQYRDE